jgi:Sortase domain
MVGPVGLALYAGTTVAVGILVAMGSGSPAPAAAPSLAEGTVGRQLIAARVLPGPSTRDGGRSPAADARIPAANVDPGSAAEVSFRPLTLLLPGGATTPVLNSGLHADGSLVIPDNPATVGWWNGGAEVGDPYGSVVIAGHVDSARYGLGVMAQLRTLRLGQLVELRAGSLRQRYRITARQQVPQADLAADSDAFRQDIAPRLVLITCGGAFDPARHRYQDNLLLFADPVP